MITFLLQHNNTRPHTSLKTLEYLVSLGWAVLPHSPYSLDLAPSDFQLLRPMKDGLHGEHFTSNDIIMTAVNQWVFSTGAGFYECSMQALAHCWRTCKANGGGCVEKWFIAENLPYQSFMLFVSVVVSMEINRKHYVQSNLWICVPRQLLLIHSGPGKPKDWTPIRLWWKGLSAETWDFLSFPLPLFSCSHWINVTTFKSPDQWKHRN